MHNDAVAWNVLWLIIALLRHLAYNHLAPDDEAQATNLLRAAVLMGPTTFLVNIRPVNELGPVL